MVVMGVCGAMLLVGLALAVRWRGRPFESPPPLDAPSAGEVARRYVWYCSLVLLGGITTGILVLGAGGRLAMRLLAVTAGDAAQGRITEADEIVGEITVGGTVSFIVFNGVFGGVAAAALYLVLRRLLPPRWAGGLCFGVGLLVVLGTTVDPLRDDNRDFDIVGPGWLSVLVFTVLALAFGAALATWLARLSAWLPLLSRDRSTLLRYLPVVVLALVGFSLTGILVVVGVVVVLATRWPPLVGWVRSPAVARVGQVVLVALVLVSLPASLQSIADIVNR